MREVRNAMWIIETMIGCKIVKIRRRRLLCVFFGWWDLIVDEVSFGVDGDAGTSCERSLYISFGLRGSVVDKNSVGVDISRYSFCERAANLVSGEVEVSEDS